MIPPTPQFPLVYPDLPFHQFLEHARETWPESVGLLFEGERYTYRELDALSNALANGLAGYGIGRGDRIALYLTNRPEWIVALFAVSKLGASAVLVSAAWKETEVRHALSLTGHRAVIADGEGLEVIERVGRPELALAADPGTPSDGWVSLWSVIRSSSHQRENHLDGDLGRIELALPFSSGTTGLPKAVRHSHRSLVVSAIQWKATLRLGDTDALQTFTPLAHILGVANIGAAVASGAPVRLFRRFDLEAMLESIQEDRITVGVVVAPIAVAMANLPDLESYDFGSLRYFNWSATPVSEPVAHRVTERTGVRWMPAYGATESPVLFANPVKYPELWRLDSPGLAASDVEAGIVDLATHEPVPAGERGEIVVRSAGTMLGYLPDEANDDAFLPGGWFRTGDVGWMEPEGWLHITDRVKEMIKVSGYQVAPGELEAVLFDHPHVSDCAVFGIDHPAKGAVPHAAVVAATGVTPDVDELISWVGSRLAHYKRLAGLHLVEEIPRTPSGKTLRRALTEEYSRPPSTDL